MRRGRPRARPGRPGARSGVVTAAVPTGGAGDVLWHPAATGDSAMARFIAGTWPRAGGDYFAAHAASIDDRAGFWSALWRFAGIQGDPGSRVLADDAMPGARWFPDARLDFTANVLSGGDVPGAQEEAIVWRDELGSRATLTWAALRAAVEHAAGALAGLGVRDGDRVAAIAANRVESIVAALASARLGAAFSSCSPDFGTAAIVDRFTQVAPKVLLGTRAYPHATRWFDCRERFAEVRARLPSVEHAAWLDEAGAAAGDTLACLASLPTSPVVPRARPFATPLYVMFSSGTTGAPKCIVHGAGGTLLKHRGEHLLHCDFRPGERVFFHTTCGWMMWNWLLSALAGGSTVCLYEGSPAHPDTGVLLRFLEEERVDHAGVSPGYLQVLATGGYDVPARHALRLRSVLSTGSPLSAELFRWSARHFAPGVRLSSITGGTDILGCFALGNPLLPVRAGEIQAPALGMDIAFVDEAGAECAPGQRGELVCRQSFPSMPLGFLGDADGSRYRAVYFAQYPGIWHHGDYGERTAAGGVIIHGRSDATLNRGGVRIGTAEIYRQVEQAPGIAEALAVPLERGDRYEIVLFVRLQPGVVLDAALDAHIRDVLRRNASPRHVPDRILAAPDLPRTRSGKLTELAVREALHGRPVKNTGALANPESLQFFRELDLSAGT
jgi:acetoacetyl-CoA synthetase